MVLQSHQDRCGRLHEDVVPLLWRECFLAVGSLILSDSIATRIATLAVEITSGGNTANEEWRYVDVVLFPHLLPTLIRFLKERLHTESEFRFPRIQKHILVCLRHDVADASAHVGS